VNAAATLARLLVVIDASKVPERLETLLPVGVRPRQLSVRTLLLGMLLTLADGRPAHLSRVHGALVGLDDENRRDLGVVRESKHGPHTLTYRQVEYTFSLVEKGAEQRTFPTAHPKRRSKRSSTPSSRPVVRAGRDTAPLHLARDRLDRHREFSPRGPHQERRHLCRQRGVVGAPQKAGGPR
jgi:hypothetical protein